MQMGGSLPLASWPSGREDHSSFLTLSLPRNLCAGVILSKKEFHRWVKTFKNFRSLELCFSGMFIKSPNVSKVSRDFFLASGKHFPVGVI